MQVRKWYCQPLTFRVVALEGQTLVTYQLSGFSTFHFENLP